MTGDRVLDLAGKLFAVTIAFAFMTDLFAQTPDNLVVEGVPAATPELRARFAAMGLEITLTTPQQFAQIIRADSDRWGKVIRAANIKPQ